MNPHELVLHCLAKSFPSLKTRPDTVHNYVSEAPQAAPIKSIRIRARIYWQRPRISTTFEARFSSEANSLDLLEVGASQYFPNDELSAVRSATGKAGSYQIGLESADLTEARQEKLSDRVSRYINISRYIETHSLLRFTIQNRWWKKHIAVMYVRV